MKKLVAIAAAMALLATFGAGMAFASSATSNGVPAQKTSVGSYSIDFSPKIPSGSTDNWSADPYLTNIPIHVSNNGAATLVITFSAETALATDVNIQGNGNKQTSTSWGGIKVMALVDNSPASVIPNLNPAYDQVTNPTAEKYDGVTLNSRLMTLTGLLYSSSNVSSMETLPTQFIDIYEKTKSANSFTFYAPDLGAGTHYVTIEYSIDWGETTSAINSAFAVVGKRTCVIELDNINPNSN